MMKLCARALMVSFPLLVTLPSVPASAQNVAAADALFKKGQEELAKKNYKEACPAFRESYKLDPAPGALHALAMCHVEAGEVASALVRLDEYLRVVEKLLPNQKAKHAARAKHAKEQRAALAPEVPELTLVLPATAPPGTRVVQDSVELSQVSLGIGLPIDPGEHVATTQTPGGPVKEHRFMIQKGEKKRLELTVADPIPPPKTSRVVQGEAASRPSLKAGEERPIGPVEGKDADARNGRAGMNSYRVGAYVAGGIGAAALVGGAVAGFFVLDERSTIHEHCIGTRCKSEHIEAAREAADNAKQLGIVSTAGFVIGAVGLAGGAVLFLTEPNEKPVESQGRQRGESIGVGLISAGPFKWTAGVKGAW